MTKWQTLPVASAKEGKLVWAVFPFSYDNTVLIKVFAERE